MITTTALTRAAGLSAVAGGLLFLGVQIGHPHLDVEFATTTEFTVRQSVKIGFTVLSLVGITGVYLRQVRQVGVLGLVGYLLLSAGYLGIMSTAFVAAYVLPSIAGTDPAYVADVLAAASNGRASGDIGLLQTALDAQGVGYLLGSLLLGIALYRARVVARWAAALLAVSGVLSVALAVMPDAFYRLLAVPHAVALIALGYSLWVVTRPGGAPVTPRVTTAELSTAGVG